MASKMRFHQKSAPSIEPASRHDLLPKRVKLSGDLRLLSGPCPKKVDDYSEIDRLGLDPDQYHNIEDYIVKWLLTSCGMAPRCYLIVLSAMMRKRVINAKIRKCELDARHTKNVICILMVLLIYQFSVQKSEGGAGVGAGAGDPNSDLMEDIHLLFHHYYHYIGEFLKREENGFTNNVRKSLSLIDKFRSGPTSGSGSGSRSVIKSDYQFDFVRENYTFISNYYLETCHDSRERSISLMDQNFIIQKIYSSSVSMRHSDHFEVSIEQMNLKYKEISITEFLVL